MARISTPKDVDSRKPQDSAAELDPRQAPSFYIKRIASELTRRAEAGLRPLGVGMGSLPVLAALNAGLASTQAELAKLLHVEQPSMAQTLSRLERDGLIRRQPHPSHKRIQLIEVTPAARAILPRSKSILLEGNEAALRGFSDEERQQLLAFVKRIHGNLADAADSLP